MKILAKVSLIIILVVLFTAFTYTEETLWNKLRNKAASLSLQGQDLEATKVAEEALEVAEKTFGSDHCNVALSLNELAEFYEP